MAVAIGDMRVAVSLPPLIIASAWFMPSTAPALTRVTFIISVPLTVV
jgi:hypothetical protein